MGVKEILRPKQCSFQTVFLGSKEGSWREYVHIAKPLLWWDWWRMVLSGHVQIKVSISEHAQFNVKEPIVKKDRWLT